MAKVKKIGILNNRSQYDDYEKSIILYFMSQPNYELKLIKLSRSVDDISKFAKIRNSLARKPLRHIFLNQITKLLMQIVLYIERKIVLKRFPNHFNLTHISLPEILPDTIYDPKTNRISIADGSINELEEEKFDVLIRMNDEILTGRILNISRLGIVSLHHGDNRINRGGPSGFWEAYRKENSVGFIIQKLSEKLDGGKILCRGNIMAEDLWYMNDAKIKKKAVHFFCKTLQDLLGAQKIHYDEPPVLHENRNFSLTRRPMVLIHYILKRHIPKFYLKLHSLVVGRKKIQWHIAFAKQDNFNNSLANYEDIKAPLGHFFADPFVIDSNEKTFCFFEDYDERLERGSISALEIIDGEAKLLGSVLSEEFHLSFPFVFEENNEHYMIPESSECNQIRLYRALEFPTSWTLEKVLFNDICAADTMVRKVNNIWYLFTNICSSGGMDLNSELHIYFTLDLLTGDWKPLQIGNPVIFNSERARNAGLLEHHGKLYRLNQVQKNSHYGASFQLNEILSISQNDYTERFIREVSPKFRKSATSTHHFSSSEKYSFIDFATLE